MVNHKISIDNDISEIAFHFVICVYHNNNNYYFLTEAISGHLSPIRQEGSLDFWKL